MAQSGNSDMEPEVVPTYYQCFNSIYDSMTIYFARKAGKEYSYPMDFFKDMMTYGDLTRYDISYVLTLATAMTLVRYLMTNKIFLPVGDYFKLSQLNKSKLPESCWKCMYYTVVWSWSVYWMVYPGKHDFFWRPLHIWSDWEPKMYVPFELYLMYLTQFSFYLHSIYATLFMDRWRRDSVVMIFHHCLTLVLVGFSYATRCHKIGVLVLLLHDFEDVVLEFTKINVYFKIRNGKTHKKYHDLISQIGFVIFGSSWFVARLYWFPLKVLYSAGVGAMLHAPTPEVPFYFFFNTLLWVLQILNAYWFAFIVQFVFRVATGRMKEVDDIREHEVEDKYKKNLTHSKGTKGHGDGRGEDVQNGDVSRKKGKSKKAE